MQAKPPEKGAQAGGVVVQAKPPPTLQLQLADQHMRKGPSMGPGPEAVEGACLEPDAVHYALLIAARCD